MLVYKVSCESVQRIKSYGSLNAPTQIVKITCMAWRYVIIDFISGTILLFLNQIAWNLAQTLVLHPTTISANLEEIGRKFILTKNLA